LKLGKGMTRPITIIAFILITLSVAWVTLDKVLYKTFNQPGHKPHTEMMLWKSPGYPQEPQLNFYKMEIYPSPENIRVVYKIENTSNKATDIQDSIDIALVAGDANNIGDPGSTVWRWSQVQGERKVNVLNLVPGGFFNEEIIIDRKKVIINSQYYINVYYKGELVLQYKIIEGILV
jgi:hypothetical protein